MQNDTISVLADNAAEIRQTAASLRVLTDTQIAELARAARKEAEPIAAFRRVFGEKLCTVEFARFCRTLFENQTESATLASLLPEFTPLGEPYADGTAAYLPNVYSDTAFERFSAALPSLAPDPQPSFNAACEEVYYDRARYCILPLQNSQDGVLSSFSRLITKYELKIYRICDVTAEDEDAVIRFALLRRGIVPRIGTAGYFEVGCVLPTDVTVAAFLSACEALGARAARIRTVPLSFTNERSSLHVTFRLTGECAAPLLMFLRSVLETYTTDGIYESIDTIKQQERRKPHRGDTL